MEPVLTVGGLLLSLPGLVIWFIILLLPWRPWSTRESLDTDGKPGKTDLSSISVLIPARNEESVISETLDALVSQGQGLHIYLIDDQSSDRTADIVRSKQLPGVEIIHGETLPEGWSGKLWALEQGRKRTATDLILLLDADIKLAPGILTKVLDKFNGEKLDLLSLMAFLRMETFWEKLLMPAFIFFFKLLYPFGLSNSTSRYVAAAAGGFILIKKNILEDSGGFESLRHCLIDDCSLARNVKNSGGRTWTGLTHSAISLREYHNLQSIWDMVARTAFTQLGYSWLLLAVCTILMTISFVFPLLIIFSGNILLCICGLLTLGIMYFCYLPTLSYYKIHPLWAIPLPVTGVIYLCMTWSSAWRHWFKAGANWKNRSYTSSAHK